MRGRSFLEEFGDGLMNMQDCLYSNTAPGSLYRPPSSSAVFRARISLVAHLTVLSTQKEILFDTPITPQDVFGTAVMSMQKMCEDKEEEDQALKVCSPRKSSIISPFSSTQNFPLGCGLSTSEPSVSTHCSKAYISSGKS